MATKDVDITLKQVENPDTKDVYWIAIDREGAILERFVNLTDSIEYCTDRGHSYTFTYLPNQGA